MIAAVPHQGTEPPWLELASCVWSADSVGECVCVFGRVSGQSRSEFLCVTFGGGPTVVTASSRRVIEDDVKLCSWHRVPKRCLDSSGSEFGKRQCSTGCPDGSCGV